MPDMFDEAEHPLTIELVNQRLQELQDRISPAALAYIGAYRYYRGVRDRILFEQSGPPRGRDADAAYVDQDIIPTSVRLSRLVESDYNKPLAVEGDWVVYTDGFIPSGDNLILACTLIAIRVDGTDMVVCCVGNDGVSGIKQYKRGEDLPSEFFEECKMTKVFYGLNGDDAVRLEIQKSIDRLKDYIKTLPNGQV